MFNRARYGFTLVELLVVVSIIALLLALLLPALNKAKRVTQETVCGTNLRGLTTVVLTHAIENRAVLPNLSHRKTPRSDSTHPLKYWGTSFAMFTTYEDWRDHFASEFGLTSGSAYSPTNPSWNASAMAGWDRPIAATPRAFELGYRSHGGLFSANKSLYPKADVFFGATFPRTLEDNEFTHDYLWSDLAHQQLGDWYGGNKQRANHIYGNDDNPTGIHVSHLDGSVDFKPWDDMKLFPTNRLYYW